MTSSKRVVAVGLAILASLASLFVSYLYRPYSNPTGVFFKIALDRGADEAAVLKQLQSAGFKGLISESTEWVYLDDFGQLEKIP